MMQATKSNVLKGAVLFALLAAGSSPASAIVLTFDDLVDSGLPVSDGYGGFDWDNGYGDIYYVNGTIRVSKTGGKYVMTALTLTIPDSSLSALRRSPTEFADEIKLAAAIHGYQRGVMSQERAAELAGLNRRDFIHALAREGMEVFILDNASLARELGMECGAQFGSV